MLLSADGMGGIAADLPAAVGYPEAVEVVEVAEFSAVAAAGSDSNGFLIDSAAHNDLFADLPAGEVFHVSEDDLPPVDSDGELLIHPDDILSGSGTIHGAVVNHGLVSPGNSPGILNVASFMQAGFQDPDLAPVAGTLRIEIAGTGRAGFPDGFDQINVIGEAVLGGALELQILNGFQPTLGQSFEFMTFGSVSGDFSSITGFDLGNGLYLEGVKGGNSYTLEVVDHLPAVNQGDTSIVAGSLGDRIAVEAFFNGGSVGGSISVDNVWLRISDFVHVSGSLSIGKGPTEFVDVRTGLTQMQADIVLAGSIMTSDSDPGGDTLARTTDGSIIWNLPVEVFTLGLSGADVFVGYTESLAAASADGDLTRVELEAVNASGVFLNEVSVGLALMHLAGSVPEAPLLANAKLSFAALQVDAADVVFLGIPEVELGVNNLQVRLNQGVANPSAWPALPGQAGPVVDFKRSYPDNSAAGAPDGDSLPDGFQVNTSVSGDPVALLWDQPVIGVSADNALLRISDFVYVSGGFSFNKGPIHKVDVRTGLDSLTLVQKIALFGDIKESATDPVDGSLARTAAGDMIWNLPVETLDFGLSGVDVFVGYTDSLDAAAADGDLTVQELEDAGAIGVFLDEITLGMVSMRPVSAAAIFLASSNLSFTALKVDADNVVLAGIPELSLSANNLQVRLNTGSASGLWPHMDGDTKPVVDFAASFPDDSMGDMPDADMAPDGYLVQTSTNGDPVAIQWQQPVIGVSADNALLRISDFVYVAGGFSFNKGAVLSVDVQTGLTLATTAQNISLFGAIPTSDTDPTDGSLARSIDATKIWNLPVDTMDIGLSGVDVYVGYSNGLDAAAADGNLTQTELEMAGAVGLFLDEVTLGMVIMKAQEVKVNSVPVSGLNSAKLKLFAINAQADALALLGVPEVTLEAMHSEVRVNQGSFKMGSWPMAPGQSKPAVDFLSSFPDGSWGLVDDADSDPDGYQVAINTAGDVVPLLFEGALLGGAADQVKIRISGFVHITGSVAFEKGGMLDAPVAGLIPADLLGVPAEYAGLGNKQIETFTLGARDLDAFVGIEGPYWVDANGNGLIDRDQAGDIIASEVNPDAIGLVVDDLDFGLLFGKPVNTLDPMRYVALKGSANNVELVGVEGLTAKVSKINVALNISTPAPGGLPILPVIDFAALPGGSFDVWTGAFNPDGSKDTIDLDFDGPVVRAQAVVELDLFSVVTLTGSIAFELGGTETVTLANGSQKEVITMTIGGRDIAGFVGLNGPYWTDLNGNGAVDGPLELNDGAVGLALTDLDFGIAVMASTELDDLSAFIAADIRIESFAFVGLDLVQAEGSLSVQLNLGVGADGLEPIDFLASFPDTDGAGPDRAGFEVNTGPGAEPVLLAFNELLINVHLIGMVHIADLVDFNGDFRLTITPRRIEVEIEADLELGPLGKLEAAGFLNVSDQGIVASLQLSQQVGISGFGADLFEFSGRYQLELNTTNRAQTIQRLNVDKETGEVNGLVAGTIAPETLRIVVGGELKLFDVITIKGGFDMTFNSEGFAVEFDGLLDLGFFGELKAKGGAIIQGSVFAMSIDLGAKNIGFDQFGLSGNFNLELNTSSSAVMVGGKLVAANSFEVHVDATLKVWIFEAKGGVTISLKDGVLSLALENLKIDFFGVVTLEVDGYIRSNGEFMITGSVDFVIKLGPIHLGGGIELTLSDTGFSGRAYGSLSVVFSLPWPLPDIDFELAGFEGRFAFRPTSIELGLSVRVFGIGFNESVIWSFGPPPILATKTGSVLRLNMGTFAHARGEAYDIDGNETYTVEHVGGAVGFETVNVTALGVTQTYTGVSRIVVPDAGSGNDTVQIMDGVLADADINGGKGDDMLIVLSSGTVTLNGGAGNDQLITAGGNDTVYGGAGDDEISTQGGNDTIYGGGGNDTITTSSGLNQIFGESGLDLIYGGRDADVIDGGAGNDGIWGDAGYTNAMRELVPEVGAADTIRGGAGDDIIRGGAGADWIQGEAGADTIYGEAGDDVLYGDFGTAARVSTNSDSGGNDKVYGGEGADFIAGGAGADWVSGGSEFAAAESVMGIANTLFGDNGKQTGGLFQTLPSAFDGNDTLVSGSGSEKLFGGGGDDRITTANGDNFIFGDGGQVNNSVATGFFAATDGNDTITSGDGSDIVHTGDGANVVRSGGGDDDVFGGDGADWIDAGAGDDFLVGGFGDDTLIGGADQDALFGGRATGTRVNYDNFPDFTAPPLFDFTEAQDEFYTGFNRPFITPIITPLESSGDGQDTLIGGAGRDHLFGGSGADNLFGDGDSLAGAGVVLEGADDGNDYLDAGSGNDLVVYGGGGNDVIRGGGGNDVLRGGSGIDQLYGEDGDDRLYGQEGSGGNQVGQRLFGGPGNDRLFGFAVANDPNESILVGDQLFGGADNDILQGSLRREILVGEDGNDDLYGAGGDDRLIGGLGADFLVGGLGDDSLDGGADNDVLFGGVATGGRTDFVLGTSDFVGAPDFIATNDLFGGIYATNYSPAMNVTPALTIVEALNDGNDTLAGGMGVDVLYGGSGDDSLSGDEDADYLDGGTGGDELAGGAGDDVIRGGDGDDVLNGDLGIDQLYGDAGDDTLFGGAGDGVGESASQEGQRLFGGAGRDELFAYAPSSDHGVQNLLVGDQLFGGAGADKLYGNIRSEKLFGGDGNDYMHGDIRAGSNYFANSSAATLGGADLLQGGRGEDQLYGGGGADEIWGGAGTDLIRGQAGLDLQYGGEGIDIFSLWLELGVIETMDGYFGNEVEGDVLGADGVPLTDDNATDILSIDGTNNYDVILLSQTNSGPLMLRIDYYERNRTPDAYFVNLLDGDGQLLIEQIQLAGLAGDDIIGFVTADSVLPNGVDNPVVQGVSDPLDLSQLAERSREFVGVFDGNSGDDILIGSAGRDRLDGGPGSDTLYGFAGDDRLWGDGGGGSSQDVDVLFAGQGNDDLIGGQGKNVLYAWSTDPDTGRNVAVDGPSATFGVFVDDNGGLHNDDGGGLYKLEATGLNRLLGAAGDDLLFGGTVLDFMYGNGGNDILFRANGERFESLDGNVAGDAWKEYARESDQVWYVGGSNVDDEITVDFVTEPGLLSDHHLITRLSENNGNFSFSAQVKLDFSATDKDGGAIWGMNDNTLDLDGLLAAGEGEGVGAKLAEIEDDPARMAALEAQRIGNLLPGEGEFLVILIDALDGNDTITVGPTVQKTVWIDAGPGDDVVTIRSGNAILVDKAESVVSNGLRGRNDFASFAYPLSLPGDGLQVTGLTIDNPDDHDWFRFELTAALAASKFEVKTASPNDMLTVNLYEADGTLITNGALSGVQTVTVEDLFTLGLVVGDTYLIEVKTNLTPTIYGIEFDLVGADSETLDLSLRNDAIRRDVILGGPGNDILQGGAGEDWIFGNEGNDVLSGGRDRNAVDLLFGGPGDDTFQIIPDALPLLTNQPNTVFDPATQVYRPQASEQLIGGEGTDRVLFLGGDLDRRGLPVPDYVALQYNTGLHRYEFVSLVWDFGGQEFKTDGNSAFVREYMFYQTRDVEQTQISTRAGNDVVNETAAGSPFEGYGIELGDAEQGAREAALIIEGGDGDDLLFGGALADVISGGEGNDFLVGGPGDDQLFGNGGDDQLFGYSPESYNFTGVPTFASRGFDSEEYVYDLALPNLPVGADDRGIDLNAATFYNAEVLKEDSLLAYYSFDGGSLRNLAPQQVPETVIWTGLVWGPTGSTSVPSAAADGRFVVGDSLQFDGVDDYLHTSNQDLFSFTVEAWVLVDQFDADWQAIVTKGDSAWRIHRYSNTDFVSFDLTLRDGTLVQLKSKTEINDGEWHHIVGTFDGWEIANLYVDGRLEASAVPGNRILSSPTHPVQIGGNAEVAGREFSGRIDDVAIYTSPLSAETIAAHYNHRFFTTEEDAVGLEAASVNALLSGITEIGDFNGDQLTDFIVRGAESSYILFGPVKLTDLDSVELHADIIVDHSAIGRPGERFGDVNGDGFADLAFVREDVGDDTTYVTVVFGGAANEAPASGVQSWARHWDQAFVDSGLATTGAKANARVINLYSSLSPVGGVSLQMLEYDGDGKSDLLIMGRSVLGAPGLSTAPTYRRMGYVFSGAGITGTTAGTVSFDNVLVSLRAHRDADFGRLETVVVGDLNGDGLEEIGVTNGPTIDHTVSEITFGGSDRTTFEVGDLDGDGLAEFVGYSEFNSLLYIKKGKPGPGNSYVVAGLDVALEIPGLRSASGGDFNGDGVMDLAVIVAGDDGVGGVYVYDSIMEKADPLNLKLSDADSVVGFTSLPVDLALKFDQSDVAFLPPSALDGLGDFTVAFTFLPDPTSNWDDRQSLLTAIDPGDASNLASFEINIGSSNNGGAFNLGIELRGKNGESLARFYREVDVPELSDGRTHHYVITVNSGDTSSSANLYVDGIYKTPSLQNGPGSAFNALSVSQLVLGKRQGFTSDRPDIPGVAAGTLDELSIWNRNFIGDEVQAIILAENIDPNDPSLNAWFRFNDLSDNLLLDSSGKNAPGRLGDPAGSPASIPTTVARALPVSLLAADLNGDGVDDLGIPAAPQLSDGLSHVFAIYGTRDVQALPEAPNVLENVSVPGSGSFIADTGSGLPELFDNQGTPFQLEGGAGGQTWFQFTTLGDGQAGDWIYLESSTTFDYRYFRFTPTEVRGGPTQDGYQISELQFYLGNAQVTGATATNPGGNNFGNVPNNAVDGSTSTKLYDTNQQPLIIDFADTVSIDRYDWATGNDVSGRDPVRWTLEGSADGTNWEMIDDRTAESQIAAVPTPRQRFIGNDQLPLAEESSVVADLLNSKGQIIVSGREAFDLRALEAGTYYLRVRADPTVSRASAGAFTIQMLAPIAGERHESNTLPDADRIRGGAGDDTLIGNFGIDALIGGGGVDSFTGESMEIRDRDALDLGVRPVATAELSFFNVAAPIDPIINGFRDVILDETFSGITSVNGNLDDGIWDVGSSAAVTFADLDNRVRIVDGQSVELFNYAARLNGQDLLGTDTIDLAGRAGAVLSFSYLRGGPGEAPDPGDDIIVSFYDGAQYFELARLAGAGPVMNDFDRKIIELPVSALTSGFQLVFVNAGAAGFDDWFIDNIEIAAPQADGVGLRDAIAAELGISPRAEFRASDLGSIVRLDLSGLDVLDIAPLRHLVNLRELDLSGNVVDDADLTALFPQTLTSGLQAGEPVGLAFLQSLNLNNNSGVTDITPLTALTELLELRLEGTAIAPNAQATLDAVAALAHLEYLTLPVDGLPSGQDLIVNEGEAVSIEVEAPALSFDGNDSFFADVVVNQSDAFIDSENFESGLGGQWTITSSRDSGRITTAPGAQSAAVGSGALFLDAPQGAVLFDGVDDQVDLPDDAFSGGTELTFAAWIKTSKAGTAVISAANASNTNEFLVLLGAAGTTEVHVFLNGLQQTFTLSATLADNQPHHIAVRVVSTFVEFFVDGAFQGINFVSTGAIDPTRVLLGQDQDSLGGGFTTAQAFSGVMDEVAVWNRQLVLSEIQAAMNGEAPKFGLRGYWKFDEISAGVAINSVVGGPGSATLVNGAASTAPLTRYDVLNEAVWTVDLSGSISPVLNFSHYSYSDEFQSLPAMFNGSSDGDGISISEDGVTWHSVWSLAGSTSWQTYSVDLTAAASSAGISLGSNIRIKFQQFDNFPRPADGLGFDEITITNATPSTGATYDAWVRPASDPGTFSGLIVTNDGGADWSVYRHNDVWVIDDGQSSKNTGVAVDAEVWQHIAVTFDLVNGVKLFKNGVEEYSSAAIGLDRSVTTVSIGGQFKGLLSEVRIWDRPLSGAEIQAGMQTQIAPGAPNLTANWRLDETSGTVAIDSSGNGMNGNSSTATWVLGLSYRTWTVTGPLNAAGAGSISASGSGSPVRFTPADNGLFRGEVNLGPTFPIFVRNSAPIIREAPDFSQTNNGQGLNEGQELTLGPVGFSGNAAIFPVLLDGVEVDRIRIEDAANDSWDLDIRVTVADGNTGLATDLIQKSLRSIYMESDFELSEADVASGVTAGFWFKALNSTEFSDYSSPFRLGNTHLTFGSATGSDWLIENIGEGSLTEDLNTGLAAQTGQWHYIALVAEPGQGIRVYQDGVEFADPNVVLDLAHWTLAIGQDFAGLIDDIRIWNRALSAAEIQNERESATPVDRASLVSHFALNEGSGETVRDSSGNGNIMRVPSLGEKAVWSNDTAPVFKDAMTGLGLPYVFTNDGNYRLSITASDDDGGSGSGLWNFTVNNLAPDVVVTPALPVVPQDLLWPLGQVVSLDASGSGDQGPNDSLSYRWEVVANNGQPVAGSIESTFAFTPKYSGHYDLTLTVSDADGGVTTVTQRYVANPVAVLSANTEGSVKEGSFIVLDVLQSSPLAPQDAVRDGVQGVTRTYEWTVTPDVGINSTPGLQRYSEIFRYLPTTVGVYTFTLKVKDYFADGDVELVSSTVSKQITVEAVDLVISGPTTGVEGGVVTFSALDLPAIDLLEQQGYDDNPPSNRHYGWEAYPNTGVENDYHSQSGADSIFSFVPLLDGAYRVRLSIDDTIFLDNLGFYYVATDFILTVSNGAPVIAAVEDQSILLGEAVDVEFLFTDPSLRDSFTWSLDWGNGTVENGVANQLSDDDGTGVGRVAGSHVYETEGVHTVTLSLNDGDQTSVRTMSVTVTDQAPPTAAFLTVTPLLRNTPLSQAVVRFSEAVTGVDAADFRLTRGGVPVAGTALTPLSLTDYRLTLPAGASMDGDFVLELLIGASGIVDASAAGNALAGDNVVLEWTVDGAAPTVQLIGAPAGQSTTYAGEIQVVFDEGVSGVDIGDFALTRDGRTMALNDPAMLRSDPADPSRYILDLTSVSARSVRAVATQQGGTNPGGEEILMPQDGYYVLVFNGAGAEIVDGAGNAFGDYLDAAWTVGVRPSVEIDHVSPDPRTTPVGDVTIRFSGNVTGVDISDFALTRDGAPVNISGLGVAAVSGSEYTINLSSVTVLEGAYALSLNPAASGIQDSFGNSLQVSARETWVMDRLDNQVVGRFLSYKGSYHDDGSPDSARATDKTALQPGQTAGFANYSSYSRGINQVLVDVSALSDAPTLADFDFKVGNLNDTAQWTSPGASPLIEVVAGAGAGGSDRIVLTWADNLIQNQWLQVTVKATGRTGLAVDDVFYFGNTIGESGNNGGDALVNATDEIGARTNPSSLLSAAAIDNPYDYNRDGRVNATDQLIARANSTTMANALNLIQPASAPTGMGGFGMLQGLVEMSAIEASGRMASTSGLGGGSSYNFGLAPAIQWGRRFSAPSSPLSIFEQDSEDGERDELFGASAANPSL